MNIYTYLENLKKKLVAIGDSKYYAILNRELKDCKSVLDLGCGTESPLSKISGTFMSMGVDVYPEDIKKSKRKKIHSKYKLLDIRTISQHFKKDSYDAVIALDVVEHLKKKESLKIIKDMERIACKKVIVLTPNGYYDQDALGGNPYQVHKSGWQQSDFTKRGYKVYGLRGWKLLRGNHAEVKIKPWILGGLLVYLSEQIFYYFPSFSFDLFSVKNVS